MALHADEDGCGCAYLWRWRWTCIDTPRWWDRWAHRLPLLMDIDKFFVKETVYLCETCS